MLKTKPDETDRLLDREAPLSKLHELLARSRAGRGQVALVTGEAGIGKTALLRELSRQLPPEVRVFWGACDDLLTQRPFAAVQEMAWAHPGAWAEALRRAEDREDVFRLFLEEFRTPRPPALVVMEDVHWADGGTLDLLRFVARRAEQSSVLWAFSWRDEELPPTHPLRALINDLGTRALRIQLHGLSPAAVNELASRAQRNGDEVYSLTGGNPLFVHEVLVSTEQSSTVRDAVLRRASRLSEPARNLLDQVSVVPSRIELTFLAEALGSGVEPLDEADAAGLLKLEDGWVSYRHELVRRCVADALPSTRAATLHARILRVLEARGDDAALLARKVHHAEGAHDADAILRWAPKASAHAAALGAHREAAAHLASALRHGDRLPPAQRADLLEARGYQCFLTDLMEEGVQALETSRKLRHALGDRVREGHCLRWLSRLSWYQARNAAAERYADAALTVLRRSPGFEQAMAWSNRSQLSMCEGDIATAETWGNRALRWARRHRNPEIQAHALNNLGCAAIEAGRRSGWKLLEQSVRVCLDNDLQDHAARAYANLGQMGIEEARYDFARRWLDEGVAYCHEHQLGTYTLCSSVLKARLFALLCEWEAASAEVLHALGDPNGSPMLRLSAFTTLGLLRGRLGDTGAWTALDDALKLAETANEAQGWFEVASARAEMAWLEGDMPRVVQEAERGLVFARRAHRLWYIGPLLVWVRRGSGQGRRSRGLPAPCALELEGKPIEAARAWRQLGNPYEAALAIDASEDSAGLLNAVAILDRMGARPAAARLRARLADLGMKSVPRGPRAARRDSPADLTAREQEVLGVLAKGLSNAAIGKQLFVSPKTVDHHVSSILSKLKVSSRGAAVAAARDRGLLGPA